MISSSFAQNERRHHTTACGDRCDNRSTSWREKVHPQELARVFERFYRGDASRTRETGGAGLGLALVRELVVAIGGTVDVVSVVGQGSRFSIQLPRAQTPKVDGKRT